MTEQQFQDPRGRVSTVAPARPHCRQDNAQMDQQEDDQEDDWNDDARRGERGSVGSDGIGE
ncbi:hypothetical protein GCM10010433_21600 [Streptomyces pulveraceus]|uniref:Uncharacterized protein n=1 Tax=Streptomyces pulveraceus TaxID=68258 RepID=A0ABW1GP31_9ACTN